MNIFKRKINIHTIGPLFLNTLSESTATLTRLRELEQQCQQLNTTPKKNDILKEIRSKIFTEQLGIKGEHQVGHTLKCSTTDKYILSNLCFSQSDGEILQIDFIVITHKHIYLLEVKNTTSSYCYRLCDDNSLGYYHINSNNHWREQFPIKFKDNDPIMQSENHRSLLYNIMRNNSLLKNYLSEERLHDIIVFANNTSTIYTKNSNPELIKKLVLQKNLIRYIDNTDKSSKIRSLSLEQMKEIGITLLACSSPSTKSYTKQIEKKLNSIKNSETTSKNSFPNTLTDDELTNLLKKYRSIQAGTQPCFTIFSNETLHEIVFSKPQTLEELLKIRNIGKFKCNNYGNDIIKIIKGEIPDCLKNQL